MIRLGALPGSGSVDDWLQAHGPAIREVLDGAGDLSERVIAHLIRTARYRPTAAEVSQALAEVRAVTGQSAERCDQCSGGWVLVRAYLEDAPPPGYEEVAVPCECLRGRRVAQGLLQLRGSLRIATSVRDVLDRAEARAASRSDPRALSSLHVHRRQWEPPLPGERR